MSNNNYLVKFFKTNKKEILFIFYFIVFFITLQVIYSFARPHTNSIIINLLTADTSSKIINIITPKENTYAQKGQIVSGFFRLKIAKGCEGIEAIFILVAAILAYSARFSHKLFGLVTGIFLLYLFNLLRVVGLYYTLKYKPGLFDLMHIYMGQTIIVIIAVFYFIMWLNYSSKIYDKKTS